MLLVMDTQQAETDHQRVQRLMEKPDSASTSDVVFLAAKVSFLEGVVVRGTMGLRQALKGDGRFYGLREAAELVDAASRKSVTIRVTDASGHMTKREKVSAAVNEKLLQRVANLIRQYAADAQTGKFDAEIAEAPRDGSTDSQDSPAEPRGGFNGEEESPA